MTQPAQLEDSLAVTVRPATAAEVAEFVIPSWLQSYTRSLPAKFMRSDSRYGPGRERYWSAMRARVERILATSTTSVRVAVIDDLAAGWVCDDQRNRTIHYLYVRESLRRQGVGRALTPWLDDAKSGIVVLTHMPPPFYTRPDPTTSRTKWREHVVIDLISA